MRDHQYRSARYWREHDENIARLAAAVLEDNAELAELKAAARAAAHKRLREYDHEAEQRQRLQDMCEDSGLVFCLPSLNPYSGE